MDRFWVFQPPCEAPVQLLTIHRYFIFIFTFHCWICRRLNSEKTQTNWAAEGLSVSSPSSLLFTVSEGSLTLVASCCWCPMWGVVVPVNKRRECESFTLAGCLGSRRRPNRLMLNISELQQAARQWSRSSDVFSVWPTCERSEWQHNQRRRRRYQRRKKETALKGSSILMLVTFFFLPKQQNVDFVPFAARTERASQFILKDFQSRCFWSWKIFSVPCLNVLESWNWLQGQHNLHPLTLISICHKISKCQSVNRWKNYLKS